MVIKTELCAFSGLKIWPGHGQRYVRVDNRVSHFPSLPRRNFCRPHSLALFSELLVRHQEVCQVLPNEAQPPQAAVDHVLPPLASQGQL
jgi:hypothetical protein